MTAGFNIRHPSPALQAPVTALDVLSLASIRAQDPELAMRMAEEIGKQAREAAELERQCVSAVARELFPEIHTAEGGPSWP